MIKRQLADCGSYRLVESLTNAEAIVRFYAGFLHFDTVQYGQRNEVFPKVAALVYYYLFS